MSDTPRTQEELLVLRKEAEAEFMKYPASSASGWVYESKAVN